MSKLRSYRSAATREVLRIRIFGMIGNGAGSVPGN
jgi:hypothetical protein